MVAHNVTTTPVARQTLSSPIVDVAYAPSIAAKQHICFKDDNSPYRLAESSPTDKPALSKPPVSAKPTSCTPRNKKGHTLGFGAARNKYGAVGKPRPDTTPAVGIVVAQPLMLAAGPQPVALLPAVCAVCVAKPAIDTSALRRAAEKKKEKANMVLSYMTPEIQPASTSTMPANRKRVIVSRSPTPGLPDTIDFKQCAAALAKGRKEHPEWLIDASRVRVH